MKMKKLLIIFSVTAFTFLFGSAFAQEQENKKQDDREPKNLRGNLTGKWKLTDATGKNSAGVWDFQADGKFNSTGHYLSVKEASFRTDENRSVVYIQVGEEISEWKARVTSEGITMTEITPGKEKNPTVFNLTKVKEPE
jgi:hypothetical protein